MTEFKLQPQQIRYASTDFNKSNRIFFKDLTSNEYKDNVAKHGMVTSHSFDMLNGEECGNGYAKIIKRAGEDIHTLTVNLKYDKENMMSIMNGMAYSNCAEDNWFSYQWIPESTPDKIEFVVPVGSYDIEVILCTLQMNYIILTATDIDVNSDKQILLDAADATVEIKWNGIMPDGATPYTNITVQDPETYEIVDQIPGNAFVIYNCLDVQNTKHNVGNMMLSNPVTMIRGEAKIDVGHGDVKTMPNSDYQFYFDQQFITQDGGYGILLVSDGLESATVTNDLNDYITLEPEYVATPYKAEPRIVGIGNAQHTREFNKDESFCISYAYVIDGVLASLSRGYEFNVGTEIKKQIHTCQSPQYAKTYQLMPIPTFLEDWDYHTIALPVDFTYSSPTFIGINNTADFNPYLNLPDNGKKYLDKIVNPWLSFDTSKSYVWNYGCPILVFSIIDRAWGSLFDYAYIGRLGENRSVDLLSTEATVSVNNAAPSNEVLEDLQYGLLPEEGKIDFKFTDTNVAIEGIQGRNIARIGFDMSRPDHQPPTLQMLRFIDINDNVTDRYTKAEDGIIEFYGGDFKCHYNSENDIDWYTEEPTLDVKLEYSPYGKTRYTSLEIENIAERNFMPGFGTYYRGSLAGVDRESNNGWFDVRITLTDADGNFQQQTISPAFKIDENVGVETIYASEIVVAFANGFVSVCGCEHPIIEIYSPNGILLKRVISSKADVSEFSHGIYLVNVIDNGKRVVRKINI